MKRLVFFVISLLFAAACSTPPPDNGDIVGTSAKFTIQGKFARIDMDAVDSISIDDGKLVVHGLGMVKEDIPADADPAKPAGHWSLTTETAKGKMRAVTFTHDESLDEFTIDVPGGDSEVHYGTLKSKRGTGEVMLLAWGADKRCYWGYLTIEPKAGAN